MSEPWSASMSGVPWNMDKMNNAVKQLRNRATVSFSFGVDSIDDLVRLDKQVFSKRPDLILYIWNPDEKSRYSEHFLETLAGLQHVVALQLDLRQQQDLSMLSALKRMVFLKLSSKKTQNLDFIRNYKQLTYLSLSGKFENLSPIADCMLLNTLVLNCAIDKLDFIVDLPMMEYLAIDSCTLSDSLGVLANSNIRMLRLSSVRNLVNIDAIGALHKLSFLHLCLPKVERLCDFSHMNNLRQLELHYMKSLQEIDNLWTANNLEALELKEIHKGIKAEAFDGLTRMDSLRQVDFRFIDFSKGRIATMHKRLYDASKEQLIYENIPEEQRIPSMALVHLASILM